MRETIARLKLSQPSEKTLDRLRAVVKRVAEG